MYKILIADDEKWIRAGLIRTVDWSRLGFDTILEASDGKTALDMSLAEKPDAIIADIKMPQMTGIEMTERLREAGSDIYVILISGFSDFVYAQRAIQCGVHEYILKPVDSSKLEGALKKCKEYLDERRSDVLKDNLEKYDHYLSIAQRHCLNELISAEPPVSSEKCMSTLDDLGMNVRGRTVRVAVIRFLESQTGSDKVINAMEKIFAPQRCYLFPGAGSNEICALFVGDDPNGLDIPEDLCKNAAEQYGLRLICGCGTTETADRLIVSHQNAVIACEYLFFKSDAKAEIHELNRTHDGNYALPSYTQLLNFLLSENYSAARKHIRLNFSILPGQITEDNAAELHKLLIEKLEHVFAECKARGLLQKGQLSYDMIKQLLKQLSLEDTQTMLEEIISALEAAHNNNSKNSAGQLVQSAISYIKAHYFENISMNTVAKYLCVNPSYFSHIFSEQVDIPFTKYLNSYRITIARQLLADPSIKIYEVAQLVGFDDYRYFSKLFKELEGIPPDQYRNLLSAD